jgi:hypothetical protein
MFLTSLESVTILQPPQAKLTPFKITKQIIFKLLKKNPSENKLLRLINSFVKTPNHSFPQVYPFKMNLTLSTNINSMPPSMN